MICSIWKFNFSPSIIVVIRYVDDYDNDDVDKLQNN
jgi:hypothetical protein